MRNQHLSTNKVYIGFPFRLNIGTTTTKEMRVVTLTTKATSIAHRNIAEEFVCLVLFHLKESTVLKWHLTVSSLEREQLIVLCVKKEVNFLAALLIT